MIDEIEVSVVLPCLNEAETLAVCITKAQSSFSRLGILGEVLVADNGSTDGSQDIAKKLKARVIHVPIKGYGSALLAGFNAAQGKFIIMGDADDSYSLDYPDLFLEELRKGSDIVMGNRFAGTIHEGAMPWLHKYIGNPVLSLIGRVFFGCKIRDFHCGMRGMNRNKILSLDLHTSGMEFASELVVKSIFARYKISEVPTDLKPDGRSRPPHLNTWRDGWRHLRFLLSYSPRWLFYYPGLIFSLLGLFGIATLSQKSRELFGIKFNLQTLVFSCFLFISGFQLIWFSLLSKASSISKGFMPFEEKWQKLFDLAKKEALYLIYLAIILVGAYILVGQFSVWADESFGELNVYDAVRKSLIGGTITFIGFQALFSHFLLSVVLMGTSDNSQSKESK